MNIMRSRFVWAVVKVLRTTSRAVCTALAAQRGSRSTMTKFDHKSSNCMAGSIVLALFVVLTMVKHSASPLTSWGCTAFIGETSVKRQQQTESWILIEMTSVYCCVWRGLSSFSSDRLVTFMRFMRLFGSDLIEYKKFQGVFCIVTDTFSTVSNLAPPYSDPSDRIDEHPLDLSQVSW